MSNQNNILDLQYQENVITIKSGESVEAAAQKWFTEVFQSADPVYNNRLFEEDGKTVYEAYTDSGSVDYLYIVIE